MRILFDTNVLLDALLAREPFVVDAAFLLEKVEAAQIEGFMSATTVTDVHYTTWKVSTQKRAETLHPRCQVHNFQRLKALSGVDFKITFQVVCIT